MPIIIKLKNIFEEKDKFKHERLKNIDDSEPEDYSDMINSKIEKIRGL